MKYRYTRVTRSFVVFFCLFSLAVVLINIIGLSRYGYISLFNFFLVMSSFLGSLITTIYLLAGYEQFNLKKHKRLINRFKRRPVNKLPSIDVFLPCAGEEPKLLERTYRA